MRPSPARDLAALRARYARVRAASETLCDPLSPEDQTPQSMPDASPAKWHLAHTSWFFETFVLESAMPGYRIFDPAYRVLFNSYYNAVGEQYARPRRGLVTRPGVDEVRAYRAHVDEHVTKLFENAGVTPELAPIVELGLHHEQQHQELILTDVLHLFSLNPAEPVYREVPRAPRVPVAPLAWRRFDADVHVIGHEGPGFAFDNETPAHREWVAAFEVADRLVTAGEYRAFIEDGGYTRPELWLSDGWAAVAAEGWGAPLYWRREAPDAPWRMLTLSGPRPVRDDEPVCHLSHYEADAYASWAGARLPRESEWEVAARRAAPDGNFLEHGRLQPVPDPGPAAGAAGAPRQMFGDVWEWTASPYTAYPGFRPAAGALGEYNGKFMSNQMVLRGGSCATPGDHVRPTYRNFFPPGARWQFSGIRLARDA